MVEFVGPSVNDRMAIEFIHGSHDAILEFLFGCDADVTQDGAGEFGKEPLDEIEPGAVLWREGEFEATRRLLGEPRFGFLGDVRGVIVEDQLDRGVGRIGGVDILGSPHNPKFLWVDDAEIVGDRIAKFWPAFGDFFA